MGFEKFHAFMKCLLQIYARKFMIFSFQYSMLTHLKHFQKSIYLIESVTLVPVSSVLVTLVTCLKVPPLAAPLEVLLRRALIDS